MSPHQLNPNANQPSSRYPKVQYLKLQSALSSSRPIRSFPHPTLSRHFFHHHHLHPLHHHPHPPRLVRLSLLFWQHHIISRRNRFVASLLRHCLSWIDSSFGRLARATILVLPGSKTWRRWRRIMLEMPTPPSPSHPLHPCMESRSGLEAASLVAFWTASNGIRMRMRHRKAVSAPMAKCTISKAPRRRRQTRPCRAS